MAPMIVRMVCILSKCDFVVRSSTSCNGQGQHLGHGKVISKVHRTTHLHSRPPKDEWSRWHTYYRKDKSKYFYVTSFVIQLLVSNSVRSHSGGGTCFEHFRASVTFSWGRIQAPLTLWVYLCNGRILRLKFNKKFSN